MESRSREEKQTKKAAVATPNPTKSVDAIDFLKASEVWISALIKKRKKERIEQDTEALSRVKKRSGSVR